MAEYISREKAIELIQPRVKPSTVYGEGYLQAIEHASDMLALMPAADVQPVKHGRWIEVTPKHSRCSVCDATCLIAVYPISYNANFCPNCGARMDKED